MREKIAPDGWEARMRGFRTRARITAVLAVAALVIAACGGDDDAGDPDTGDDTTDATEEVEGEDAAEAPAELDIDSLEIVTAPTGSIFFPLGSAIAAALESELDIPVTAAPSAGSGENVVLLDGGDSELGIIASNALVPAYRGETPYDREYPDLRPLAHLFPNGVVFFALADSGIETIADLEGKRIGVGLEARTWDHFIAPLLEAHGLVYGENVTPVYAGFQDMADQVRDGQLDAAMGTLGSNSPSPAITSLAAERPLNYLTWEEAAVEQVAADLDFINVMPDYPGDVLEGFDGDTFFTADIGGPYLTATTDLSDEAAYQITRIFHESLDQIAADVAVVRWIADAGDENLVQPLGNLPFHPGAERYWREVGAID